MSGEQARAGRANSGRGGGRTGRGGGRGAYNRNGRYAFTNPFQGQGMSKDNFFTSDTKTAGVSITKFAKTIVELEDMIRAAGAEESVRLCNSMKSMNIATIPEPDEVPEEIPDPDPNAAEGAMIANPRLAIDQRLWFKTVDMIPKQQINLERIKNSVFTQDLVDV